MTSHHNDLAELGWSGWFEERADCAPDDTIARVAAVDREQLLLIDAAGQFRARLPGSYMHRHRSSREMPCVGDWVCVRKQPADGFGTVRRILERRTCLRRKAAGDTVEYQMIAANVDTVLVVQSCHFDFNVRRLERYLVMVADGGAQPQILLTKTDLVGAEQLAEQIAEIRAADIEAPIASLSNVTLDGIEELQSLLLPRKTYCFVGSSGVGKSTLINHLIGRDELQVEAVSGTGEGRHTTVRRELIRLDCGALVIDNPGMREFGVLVAGEGLDSSYADIASISAGCRYRDCTHTGEPGCAVVAAANEGELSQSHLDSYFKLRQESEFYQMSYAERRKKDRDFGKFIKTVKKGMRKSGR